MFSQLPMLSEPWFMGFTLLLVWTRFSSSIINCLSRLLEVVSFCTLCVKLSLKAIFLFDWLQEKNSPKSVKNIKFCLIRFLVGLLSLNMRPHSGVGVVMQHRRIASQLAKNESNQKPSWKQTPLNSLEKVELRELQIYYFRYH